MINFNKEFNKLVFIENDSTLLNKRETISKEKRMIKQMYELLTDDLKLEFLDILKDNTINDFLNNNLSQDEKIILKRTDSLKNDYFSLLIILNHLSKVNLENLVKK